MAGKKNSNDLNEIISGIRNWAYDATNGSVGKPKEDSESGGNTASPFDIYDSARSAFQQILAHNQQDQYQQPQYAYQPAQAEGPIKEEDAFESSDGGKFASKDEDDKKKKRSPWHQAIDEAVPPDNILSDLINTALSYSGPVSFIDTFSPEWAWRGSQKEDVPSALAMGSPKEAVDNGTQVTDPWSMSMPSGGQISQLSEKQREQWQEDALDGLIKAYSAAAMFLPSGGGLSSTMSPTLGFMPLAADFSATTGKKIAQGALKEGKLTGKAAEAVEKTIPHADFNSLLRSYIEQPLSKVPGIEYAKDFSKAAENEFANPGLAEANAKAIEELFPNAFKAADKAAAESVTANSPLAKTVGKTTSKFEKAAQKQAKEALDELEALGNKGSFKAALKGAGAGLGATTLATDPLINSVISDLLNEANKGKDDSGKSDGWSDMGDGFAGTGGGKSQGQTYNDYWLTEDGKQKLAELEGLGYDADFLTGDRGYYNFLNSMDKNLALNLINSIPTWDARYKAAGVKIDDADSIYDYMWLANPVIASEIIGSDNYDYRSHGMSDADIAMLLPLLMESEAFGPWSANDLAEAAYMIAAGNGNIGFDLNAFNDISGPAGEGFMLGFADEDSSLDTKSHRSNPRDRYSWQDLEQYGDELLDLYFLDTAVKLGEEATGRKVGIKGRD